MAAFLLYRHGENSGFGLVAHHSEIERHGNVSGKGPSFLCDLYRTIAQFHQTVGFHFL